MAAMAAVEAWVTTQAAARAVVTEAMTAMAAEAMPMDGSAERRRRSDAGPRRGAEAIGVTSGDAAEARVAVAVATEAPARATEATAVTAVTAATANGMVVDACRAAKQSRSTSARVRKEMDGRRGGGGEDVKGT